MIRANQRETSQIRSLNATFGVQKFSNGSVLFEMGDTKILCSITMQNGVPHFLRGKGRGWLTAEYAMLPGSTQTRTSRESSSVRRSGRSVEISRLIGRCIRPLVMLTGFGERTIYLDCDVLQADGGTRTAAVSGSCIAFKIAQAKWLESGLIRTPILKEDFAAVAVGIVGQKALLDIDYAEDSTVDADLNFVFTRSGDITEVQGSAENNPISRAIFDSAGALAWQGAKDIFNFYDTLGI
ncbi:ribonuclease PH [bacterium]|nr:ribonuclease PH [bacterium]MBT3903434.1 ribonuclease PH [bacterium]MBT5345819.1 ribonuclease PH [bacterium]MBT6131293.1 ribonuclease PH [bacterium]